MKIHQILMITIILSFTAIVKSQYAYNRPKIFAQLKDLVNYENGNKAIPGNAGTDYPIFSEIPETGFRCNQQRYPGYYGDIETRCQVFHICQKDGRNDSFLCPNGTIFNQEWLICDWWYNFNCSKTENFYFVNEDIVRSMNDADIRLNEFRDSQFVYQSFQIPQNSIFNSFNEYVRGGKTPVGSGNGFQVQGKRESFKKILKSSIRGYKY